MLERESRRFYTETMDGFASPEGEEISRKERYERILRLGMRECLTKRQREIVSLYYLQGMTMAQVGKKLGIGTATVSKSLKRSRQRLALVAKLAEIILQS